MKKKIFSLCFSLLVLVSTPTFSQGPGEPYFAETANGAKNIHATVIGSYGKIQTAQFSM